MSQSNVVDSAPPTLATEDPLLHELVKIARRRLWNRPRSHAILQVRQPGLICVPIQALWTVARSGRAQQ
jgi:hypothetical protein